MKILKYILIIFLIIQCDSDNGFTPSDKEVEELVLEGWEKFGYRGYANALEKFLEAIDKDDSYAEAYNGAGWASARLTNLSDAVNYFNQCIALSSTNADARAGLAFTYNAQKDYQSAIDQANSALGVNAVWIFSQDKTLSHRDLRVVLAESYFALGNLTASLNQVLILNPSFSADINTFDGKSSLSEEIERLRGIV